MSDDDALPAHQPEYNTTRDLLNQVIQLRVALEMAFQLLALGKWEVAMEYLRKVIQSNPVNAQQDLSEQGRRPAPDNSSRCASSDATGRKDPDD